MKIRRKRKKSEQVAENNQAVDTVDSFNRETSLCDEGGGVLPCEREESGDASNGIAEDCADSSCVSSPIDNDGDLENSVGDETKIVNEEKTGEQAKTGKQTKKRARKSKAEKSDEGGKVKTTVQKGVEYIKVGTYRSQVYVKEKLSVLRKLSAIWTLISTAYAIVSTCLFISRDWVSSTVSYVLIGILSVYILAFFGLIVYVARHPKKGTRTAKYYKKVLGIFKAFINIVFLILTAVSMAGMAANDMSAGKWFMFVMSFIVAFVQFGFKLALLISKLVRRWISKRFKVKIENYKDGRKKKNTVLDSMTERKYKEKD